MATPNDGLWRQPQPEKDLSLDDITIVDKSLLKRAVGAMAIGNAMEWFDFGVYSYIAVTLGKVFFPSANPGAQLIATFGTFAAAFLVRPLGGMQAFDVDVRIISATWAPLEERVENGQFREDLFHRISTFVIRLPPLRARKSDIPALD